MADNPQTTSGTGGAGPPAPVYAANPPGSVQDSDYLSANAVLKQQISSQYGDILAQLGYMDPSSGMFIPGSVEQGADINTGNLQQQMALADQGVDQNAQNQGTFFSGVRGTQRANAEQPYMQQIGGINFDTANTLAGLQRQAGDLMNQYNTQNMQLLSDAADRAAAAATANPITPVAAPDPTPAPVVSPPPNTGGSSVGTGYGGAPQPPPGHAPVPPIGFAKGGEISRPTRAVLGEHSRPGDPRSHEVVIPRDKLSDEGNAMLDHVMNMAGLRHAALARAAGQAPLGGSIGPGSVDAHDLISEGQGLAGAQLWEQRHPAAVHAGHIPGFVSAAMAQGMSQAIPPSPVGAVHRLAGMLPPGHVQLPHPGVLPLGGGDMLADQANHDSLAHAIGSAALARIGVHPPSAFQAGQVIHSFGPGSLPPTPMPPVHPILGPAVAS